MTFKAPIGIFSEEKILTNTIIIQLDIEMNRLNLVKNLEDTLDYSQLYKVVKKEVYVSTDLLEDTLQRILSEVKTYIDEQKKLVFVVQTIYCEITKINPPIKGQIESVTIKDQLTNYTVKNKKCVKCGNNFSCNSDGNSCWCNHYSIDKKTLERLAKTFYNCLCESCFKEEIDQ